MPTPQKLPPSPRDNPTLRSASSESSSVASSTVSSSYRHHKSGPFVQDTRTVSATDAAQPQPVLGKDAAHKPKTTGSCGIMVVGLGGANGCTLLAGVIAHRLGLNWHGPTGEPRSPNYNGCITQLKQRGGGVGYQDRVKGLADVSMAAVGGWDIRPTKPGDALLQAQILDYDLVRQVQEEMNKVKVFRGVYDARFIGSSQHATATHILTASTQDNTADTSSAPDHNKASSDNNKLSDSESLKCLRADIRYFKWRNGVVGHTTVIWSASVEPNSAFVLELQTADQLLSAIEMTQAERGGEPLPPSLLYATAALLEGCSFINGGSQNTVSCPGLADLAQQQLGVYCLGTDFKAGQTKFKTAAVEYLRTAGLKPVVIASSNHLGNNDMRNLASAKSASTAKLRVKHDIFAPWEEHDLDHKVSIMFTEYINDDKRDFVEYTSLGFMGQVHTMVTYTRASDSVLCVPLMIDSAVWCDYFSRCTWPYEKVAKAMAYLFKVPEGAAKGVDPGFFCQMQELERQVMAAHVARNGGSASATVMGVSPLDHSFSGKKKRVRIRPDVVKTTTEWAIPHNASIICAGLACVDMQLNQATGGDGGEGIETFEGEKSIGGGSVSMACKTLARLCHGAPLDEDTFMQVTPPVVHSVIPLCKVGNDGTGDKLIHLLENCGQECRNVETRYIRASREQDNNKDSRTALAVLPIYQDGRRGCFFDAASNTTFSAREMVEMMNGLSMRSLSRPLDTSNMTADDIDNYHADLEQMAPSYGAFLFGYPHLLPSMQGEALAQILLEARSTMIDGGVVVVDLNGVPEEQFPRSQQPGGGFLRSFVDLKNDPVIGAALEHIDILHMNEDELCLLTGCSVKGTPESQAEDDFAISTAVNLFLMCGVAIVAVTRGKDGCYVSCNNEERFKRSGTLPASWIDCTAKVGCVQLPDGTVINSNGAGDAFTAGLLVATMLRHTGMTVPGDKDGPTTPVSSVNNSMESVDSRGGGSAAGAASSSTPASTGAGRTTPGSASSPQQKKLTPYALYMQENYVTLKAQLKGDKKAIFTRCHEMWENESAEVKALYERRATEENEEGGGNNNDSTKNFMNDMDALDASKAPSFEFLEDAPKRNLYMTNRSLNLESALQFASLVAAYHIDVSTRDRPHINVSQLLSRAMVFPSTLEEI